MQVSPSHNPQNVLEIVAKESVVEYVLSRLQGTPDLMEILLSSYLELPVPPLLRERVYQKLRAQSLIKGGCCRDMYSRALTSYFILIWPQDKSINRAA